MPSQSPSGLRYAFIAVLAAVVIAVAVIARDLLSFDALRDHRAELIAMRDARYGLTALAYVAFYALVVAFSVPGAVFVTLAGGFLFGLWAGTVVTVIGASLGAVAVFLAARWGLGASLAARMTDAGGMIAQIKRGLEDNQWSMLFLIRLVPVVPFFVANLIPALLNVPLGRFAITTALGIVPGTFVYTSVGAGLGTTFDQGDTPDLGILFEPHVLGPFLGLSALAALPIMFKALSGGKASS